MKYMAVLRIHEENIKGTIKSWATGNPQPPEGVTMTGRSPKADFGRGFIDEIYVGQSIGRPFTAMNVKQPVQEVPPRSHHLGTGEKSWDRISCTMHETTKEHDRPRSVLSAERNEP